MQATRVAIAVSLSSVVLSGEAYSGALRPGDLVATDPVLNAVFLVDPHSGQRTILSGLGVGSGRPLANPTEVAIGLDHSVYVVSRNDSLVRIDPSTGNRDTLVSVDSLRRELSFTSLTMPRPGLLAVVDSVRRSILHIDTQTHEVLPIGHRLPATGYNSDIVAADDSSYFMVDSGSNLLRRVPIAQNFTTIEEIDITTNIGPGALLVRPNTIALADDGSLYLGGNGRPARIVSLNATTSRLELLSAIDDGPNPDFYPWVRGNGPRLISPQELVIGNHGELYATSTSQGIVRIDVVTGDRTIVTGPDDGEGPAFTSLVGLAVTPIPEPSSRFFMAAYATAYMLGRNRYTQTLRSM